VAGLLSYLVPGLGQIYQGRVGKGVLFFVCIYTLFFYGLFLGSWRNVYLPDTVDPTNSSTNPWGLPRPLANLYNRPHFVGQFWVGAAAWPAVWQYYTYDPRQNEHPPLDGFMRQPPEEKLNDLARDGDKGVDLAWVYTVIAGVLNIMVIYDAFAGPAFVPRLAEEPKDAKGPHANASAAGR
jgi:hypothetical protein